MVAEAVITPLNKHHPGFLRMVKLSTTPKKALKSIRGLYHQKVCDHLCKKAEGVFRDKPLEVEV